VLYKGELELRREVVKRGNRKGVIRKELCLFDIVIIYGIA